MKDITNLITTTGLKDRVNYGTDTSMDAVFIDIVAGVEGWVQSSFLRRKCLVKNTATPLVEYQDGWTPNYDYGLQGIQRHILRTREWPVLNSDIISFICNEDIIPPRPSISESGYFVDEGDERGRILVQGYPLPIGNCNIELTYTPGYSTTGDIPPEIAMAEYAIAAAVWNKRGVEGMKETLVGNVRLYTKELAEKGEISDALRWLMPHRRM